MYIADVKQIIRIIKLVLIILMTNFHKRFGIKNKDYACDFTARKNFGKEWTQNHWFETFVDVDNMHSKAGRRTLLSKQQPRRLKAVVHKMFHKQRSTK